MIRRGHIAVAFLLFAVYAFDALGQLDGLLQGMHVAGQPSFGVSDLASKPADAVRVWEAHKAATPNDGTAAYETVFGIYFWLDCSVALVLGGLLSILAGFGGNRPAAKLVGRGAAVLYVASDLLENLAARTAVDGDAFFPAWLSMSFMYAKLGFLAVSVAVVAGLAWSLWHDAAGDDAIAQRKQIRNVVRLLRVPLVLAPAFGIVLIAHEQIADVIRRWTVLHLLYAVLAALFFAGAIWVTARELVNRRTPFKILGNPWIIVGAVAALAAVQVVGTLLLRASGASRDLGWGLLVLAGILFALALFSELFGDAPDEEIALGAWTTMLPALLAAAAVFGLGLGALHASFGEGVHTRALWQGGFLNGAGDELDPLFLVFFAVAAAAASWLVYWLLSRLEPARSTVVLRGLLVVGVALSLILLVVFVAWPRPVGETLGGVALLAAFLALVTMVAAVVVWLSDAIPYPEALPGRTAPILLVLVAWFAVTVYFDKNGPHDIRVEESRRAAVAPRLGQAWACWLVKNGLERHPGRQCPFASEDFTYRTESPGGAVPLVVVATSGGATRAAYWTATVLDCVLEVMGPRSSCAHDDPRVPAGDFRRSNTLFALSGISGGSVGAASYAAHLVERADVGLQQAWIDERLDRDFLSPTIGWQLYVELPQSLLRFRTRQDRAEVLERSWETAWGEGRARGDLGLFELWRAHHVAPLLLLNGTSVEDGCRFNGSVLDASVETLLIPKEPGGRWRRRFHDCRATGPFDEVSPPGATEQVLSKSALGATRDLADFLCGTKHDMPLATTAILSARFPYVSPSGRVERRCEDEDQGNKVTFVVDGGYLETSGASPLVELFDKLGPMIRTYNGRAGARSCVVPFMIQIDNGYEDDAAAQATKRPTEALVPPLTLAATRGARAAMAKAQSALLFDRGFGGAMLNRRPLEDRYTHFVMQAHAGAKAPLGWALSETARAALRRQLRQPKNMQALAEARSWLRRGALSCPS